jgi:hypothetical protein
MTPPKICMMLLAIFIWVYSFYIHFIVNHSPFMIAFIGKEHSKLFQHSFGHYNADLWVFGHRKRRSTMTFSKRKPFEIFAENDYEHLLVVHEIHHMPMILDAEKPIAYVYRNKTIGTLWPRSLAITDQDYIEKSKTIEKIYL